MTRSMLSRATMLLGAFAIIACGDDDDPITPGSLVLSATPTTVTIAAGSSATMTATISRGGSFTGPVALTATGAPTGVTVTFTAPTIPSGQLNATGTISVDGTAVPGTYPIVVTATGTGVSAQTVTVNVTVTAPPAITQSVSRALPPSMRAPAALLAWQSA